MATLPSLFKEFLEDIRSSSANIEDYIEGHKTLREKLQESDTLDDIHVADFLQGSYARSTALRHHIFHLQQREMVDLERNYLKTGAEKLRKR